ncbi:MAG: mechanosensitive ion channel [Lachnospiraceae bacterium]|nr:mechanosensitive ion channel [Lachnospiraceae bacterium]
MGIGEYFSNLLGKIIGSFGGVLAAILLLVLGFIIASLVRSLVVGLLKKTKLAQLNMAQPGTQNVSPLNTGIGIIDYIGKFVYLFVFLLFVPGIFTALGVGSIVAPLTTLLNSVWGYVPNIFAAIIVLIAGSIIAKLVRELLIPLFQRLKVDELQQKFGIQADANARFSVTLAYIVYVFIMIPVVIVALQALNITAVSGPAVSMLTVVFSFIPQIVIAIVLIWIGALIGKFTGQIVCRLIASSGADAKVKDLVGDKAKNFVLSKTVGLVVTVVLDIFFIVEGVDVLKLNVLSGIGEKLIAYMPNVLAAVLIMIAAFFCAAALEKVMKKGGLKDYAIFAKAAVIVVAVFMALNQLGIAAAIVNAAFVIVLAALGIAFAIAFGVGGRKFASDQLDKLEKKIDEEKKES